jgi:SAM-dependent methyltransferase
MCHRSVLAFVMTRITTSDIRSKKVLEVGALDVNGSPRGLIELLEPESYVGVDIRPGPKVDKICGASELVVTFGVESFGVVVSTEMLEHAEDWRGAVSNMKKVLAPGGLLLITTRSPGFPQHDHPGDYWRFTKQDALEIFSDMEEIEVTEDPMAPGILVRARKPATFLEIDLATKNVSAV